MPKSKDLLIAERARLAKEAEQCGECRGKNIHPDWIQCDDCDTWYHGQCIGLSPREISNMKGDTTFQCNRSHCRMDEAPANTQDENSAVTQDDPADVADNSLRDITNEQQDDDSSEYSTDEEGYSGVKAIVDGKKKRGGKRVFRVLFRDKTLKWIPEENLDRSITLLQNFCRSAKMSPTRLKYDTRVGASSLKDANTENWATLGEIMRMVEVYGHKDGLEVKVFEDELGKHDCIYLIQIGFHCYTALFIASSGRCFVSDGENTFTNVASSRRLLLSKLTGARNLRYVAFSGQSEKDHCASSAAAIAIEFQRLYKSGESINIIQAPKTTLQRIRKQLHKEAGDKLVGWEPVRLRKIGVDCPKCGKNFKGNNRSVLNFHQC